MMGNNTESNFNQRMNNSQIDAHFIEQMIPHHQDAITMAQLALEKGQHQEIKTLAQNIISSQSSEIEQMKNWYKTWYGRDLPTGNQVMNVHGMMSNNSGMHMGKMGDDSDLDQLKNTADFDKKFIEEMIPHHQMAVMMASMLKQGTTRPEMKQLADDIITAQTSEIDQMRQWYQNWSN
jgi:uncharacterized protein (DUF305 family)